MSSTTDPMSYLKEAAARVESSDLDITLSLSERGVELYAEGKYANLRKVVPWLEVELCRVNPLIAMIEQIEKET